MEHVELKLIYKFETHEFSKVSELSICRQRKQRIYRHHAEKTKNIALLEPYITYNITIYKL